MLCCRFAAFKENVRSNRRWSSLVDRAQQWLPEQVWRQRRIHQPTTQQFARDDRRRTIVMTQVKDLQGTRQHIIMPCINLESSRSEPLGPTLWNEGIVMDRDTIEPLAITRTKE